jgi:hypothetical protein
MDETLVRGKVGGGVGRPPNPTVSLYFRLSAAEAAMLDRWIAAQADPKPTRQEAAQLLLAKALSDE